MAAALVASLSLNQAQVGAGLVNFTVCFTGGITDLKTIANGGRVTSELDVKFFYDPACTQIAPFEYVAGTYVATTGTGEWHILFPSTASMLYIGIGDPGATDLSNAAGAWNVNTRAVYHFGNNVTLGLIDSTGVTGSLTNTGATIGGSALSAGGASAAGDGATHYLTTPITNLSALSRGSISWWGFSSLVNSDSLIHGYFGHVPVSGNPTLSVQKYSDNVWYVGWTNTGHDDRVQVASSVGNAPQSTWAKYTYTWVDGGASYFYCNGVQIGTHTITAGVVASVGVNLLLLAYNNNSISSTDFTGALDEWKLFNIDLSSDWVLAEYNNQKSGATFVNLSSFAPIGAFKPIGDTRPFPFLPGSPRPRF